MIAPSSVLFITPGFAANEQDDTCIPPLQLLVKALQDRHVPVFIIALEYPFQSTPYSWYGAKVFPCNGKNQKWLRLRTHARALNIAHDLISSEDIRVIFSFWLGQAWQVGKKLSQKYNLPHFTTLMGQDVLWKNNRRYLRRLADIDFHHLIAVSDFQAQQLEVEMGKRPGYVIPWALETSEISSMADQQRPIDILGVGSLLPVKNWITWLEVVQRIVQKMPNTRAVLIGNGPEHHKIADFIEKNGLTPHIMLFGALPRKKVLEYMTQSKTLLHTAQFESFGYVLAEARALGCQVISSPVGIAVDVGITGKTVEELAFLLRKALTEESLYAPQTPFSVQAMVHSYVALFPNAPVHPAAPKEFRKE